METTSDARRLQLYRLKKFLHLRERFLTYADYSTRGLKNRDKYMRTARLVVRFEQERGIKIYTDSFDVATADAFLDFLYETSPLRRVRDREKYSMNSIIGHVRNLSCLLKFADKYGFKTDLDGIVHYRLKKEESTAVYLSTPEVQMLLDCHSLTAKETQVRDLFVIGCCTALRYSDYTTLQEANFVENRVSVLTRKTKKKVLLPRHIFVETILAHNNYNYSFLRYKGCSGDFNKTIKDVCRKAGICQRVVVSYMENRKRVEKVYEKWQCVGSHTARRSAATNMIRSGMSVPTVMLFTGHSTESSFFRYLRFTLEENAYDCQDNAFFQPETLAGLLPQYPSGVPRWEVA